MPAYPESTATPVVIVADRSAGGGGGGLTAETNEVVLIDQGNSDHAFLRKLVHNAAGAVTGATYVELDGTTAYTPLGTISLAPATQPVSGSVTATISGTPSVSISGTPTTTRSGDVLVLPMVDGTGAQFLRKYALSTAGVLSATDVQLDGTTSFTASGTVRPFSPHLSTSRPNMVSTPHRYTSANTGTVIAAGAISVELLVVADNVSITMNSVAAAVPANTAVTIGENGWGTPAITLTITGSGDVLVIENRVS